MDNPLSVYEFGRQLLEAKDLDPVYVVLWEAGLGEERLHNWLLAYWCFYHVGTASWITDQADYWKAMETAAGSKDWPRSSERRHFRGENARKSVAYLKGRGVYDLFTELLADEEVSPAEGPVSAKRVIETSQGWIGFGPWIAFKVADMLERLGILQVEFDLDTILYDSPQKAADLLWSMEHTGETGPYVQGYKSGEWAIAKVGAALDNFMAPPRGERPIGPQEVETVLCKWGSYLKGHYEIGEDVTAVREGLLRFARCRTAQRLYAGGRKGGLW